MSLKSLIALFFCIACALPTHGQQMTQAESDEYMRLWSGYKQDISLGDAIAGLGTQTRKSFGDRQLPQITGEQVIEGMLNYVNAHPKSEFAGPLMKSIEGRTLPGGSLLHFGADSKLIRVGDRSFEVSYLTYELYLGLNLDPAPLWYGGRWRRVTLSSVPLTVTEKR